jgi:hypothetical protein
LRTSRIISKRDLMILLNETYLSHKRVLRVRFPFYDKDLFSIDIEKYELKNIINEEEFDKARLKHMISGPA